MNAFKVIETEYLRASRTIETIKVSNKMSCKLFYVYNFEGNSFRVFDSLLDLIEFFKRGTESKVHFACDSELDVYLSKVQI